MSHHIRSADFSSAPTILTVSSLSYPPSRHVVIGFGDTGIGIRVEEDGHNSNVVRVEGEDLFALRELLNEMPEEAFVRPAEPVNPAEVWTEGDSFLLINPVESVIRYARLSDGRWEREALHDATGGLRLITPEYLLTDGLLNQFCRTHPKCRRVIVRQKSLGIG